MLANMVRIVRWQMPNGRRPAPFPNHAVLLAYQCGGQPNELYKGSFGAKTQIASAPIISPATNPLIMYPSQKNSPLC